MLRRRHARVIVPPESFFVDDVSGPLAGEEVDRAREWGRHLATTLHEHAHAS